MVAAGFSEDLLIGLVLGSFVGLLLGPLLRAWLSWREWVSASREANLLGDVLERMEARRWPELVISEDPDAPVSSARRGGR
ncbi:MAG: hypothetical protein ACRDHC_11270 [Actinomycetota bacterium]